LSSNVGALTIDVKEVSAAPARTRGAGEHRAVRHALRGRVVAIVNPVSGRRGRRGILREVRQWLEREGVEFRVWITSAAGHATTLARRAADEAEAVLIVGGDGTVSEVVNGLGGRDVPILILGAGTENLLARALEMPRRADEIAAALMFGEAEACDVGRINGRCFLSVAGIGFDAQCVQRMQRSRRGNITHAAYFWPIWRTFWTHRFPWLRVEVDGRPAFEGRGLAFVGGISRYAVGLNLFPKARSDDGRLDVCVLPCRTKRRLLGHAALTLGRRHTRQTDVVYEQCERARVSSNEAVAVQIDGDFGGVLPVECNIERGALKVLRCAKVTGNR